MLQLIPNEVMIKQQKGFSPQTRDWEFFYIDVDPNGSKIVTRGFQDVNNRLGLNCFECHKEARPPFRQAGCFLSIHRPALDTNDRKGFARPIAAVSPINSNTLNRNQVDY